MKMQRFIIRFVSECEMTVYAPEGTDAEDIEEIATEIAQSPSIHGWDFPEFQVDVHPRDLVDLSESDRLRSEPNAHGFRAVLSGPLADKDTVVLSDGKDDLVAPEDATWWEAP
jgi:hypothetical protein